MRGFQLVSAVFLLGACSSFNHVTAGSDAGSPSGTDVLSMPDMPMMGPPDTGDAPGQVSCEVLINTVMRAGGCNASQYMALVSQCRAMHRFPARCDAQANVLLNCAGSSQLDCAAMNISPFVMCRMQDMVELNCEMGR